MQPLKVTAHLYNGFAAADDWSPALDGILGYWQLYLADPEYFALTQGRNDLVRPPDGLPLEKIEDGEWWWWAASSPLYRLHQTHRTYFHRRFDDQHERYMEESVKTVITKAGPYKNYRKSLLFRVTDRIEWHCVGDEARILELLSHCHHVGAKPAQGYGRVKDWSVEPGDERLALYHRPLPVDYARRAGVAGPTMTWGVRPPARLPINNTLCVMPSS